MICGRVLRYVKVDKHGRVIYVYVKTANNEEMVVIEPLKVAKP